MSHEYDTGFQVRKAAWHGLGNTLAEAPKNIDEAREAAGVTWEPRKVPAYQQVQEVIGVKPIFNEWGHPIDFEEVTQTAYVEVPNAALIERDDTGVVIGHGVTQEYEPILNQTMFEICEALADEGAQWETGGSLRGGSVVWALMQLPEPFILPGDNSESHPFVSVVNHHDGSGSMRAQSGNVRIVCMNTNMIADFQSQRAQTQYTFRHTSNVQERINEAHEVIRGTRSDSAGWREIAAELHGYHVDASVYANFLDAFFPLDPGNIHSTRVVNNWENARARFTQAYNSATNETLIGTGLGLLNTATEYADHLRGYRSRDTYITRTILRPEPMKAQALKIIREVCV
jgi:phage/plasmid-like protein (TIGR03299 family)